MTKTLKVALASLLAIPILACGLVVSAPTAQNTYAEVGGIGDGANAAKGDDQVDDLFGNDGVFKTISNVALYIIGAISVLMLIYGGIRYTVSGGESAQVTAAKNTIMYAVVGLIVAILAYSIINFVLDALLG